MINTDNLFEDIRVSSFPYIDNENKLVWHNEEKYSRNGTISWDLYYNALCDFEQLLMYLKRLGFADKDKTDITLNRVYKHRWDFIKRIKKLGIINELLYNVINNQNNHGWYGMNLREGYGKFFRYEHSYSEYKNCRIWIPKLILSCQL
jgi:hypothetical protein